MQGRRARADERARGRLGRRAAAARAPRGGARAGRADLGADRAPDPPVDRPRRGRAVQRARASTSAHARIIAALREFQRDIPDDQYSVVSLWLALLDARSDLAAGLHAQASDAMLRAGEIATSRGPDRAVPRSVGRRPRSTRTSPPGASTRRARCWPSSRRARRPSRAAGRARCSRSAAPASRRSKTPRELADQRFVEAIAALRGAATAARARAGADQLRHAPAAHGPPPRGARAARRAPSRSARRRGAERLARIARAELAASGGRRRRRDRGPLDAHRAGGARRGARRRGHGERQIAAALHLSPQTVGFHLQRVYEKLGIHSRRELIRRAGEFTR